jgi:His-Xaa-Ser system protein HxsD
VGADTCPTRRTLPTRPTSLAVKFARRGEGNLTEHRLTFEVATHSADAIQRAAYKLSDRLSCDLTTEEAVYCCDLHVVAETQAEVDAVLGDFRNEVLDETLRERIRGETREVRNLILALAFSNTGLVDHTDA